MKQFLFKKLIVVKNQLGRKAFFISIGSDRWSTSGCPVVLLTSFMLVLVFGKLLPPVSVWYFFSRAHNLSCSYEAEPT